ncbi:ATP-binding protein, partial [Cribrihabitans sp. XS_ASV171]
MTEENPPYVMSIDLNVIKHLGIGLYNSNPVVIAEAVANSWDANAKQVDIRIARNGHSVTIEDDGHGMDREQVNARFLNIGYERRKTQGEKTEGNLRLAMGRKGIGKLSLFAISDDIYVYTKRKNGPVEAFRLNSAAISEQITDQNSSYHPEPIEPDWEDGKESGTKIVLRQLKRDLSGSSKYLKERLARRFSIIGPANDFSVSVDGNAIGVADRGYLKHLEYIWHIGDRGKAAADETKAKKKIELRSDKIEGWIGTVVKPSQLKDQGSPSGQSANGIVVMIRGRVAHENILDSIGEAGIYAQYVVGELHA